MSDIRSGVLPPTAGEPSLHRLVDPPRPGIESALAWLADRCSPVLVKEIRQALKSRSFLITFMLLLLASVVWSILGISLSFEMEEGSAGAMMLTGYLYLLGFPLIVVVPMSAFRSIAREHEEETLHLVSITTMTSRRLAAGKLVSALCQMVLYLSALAPCVAFSWLLRGVGIPEILLALLLAVTGSAALSSMSLMMGAAGRGTVLRVILQVALVVLLMLLYWGWCAFQYSVMSGGFGDVESVAVVEVLLIVLLLSSTWVCMEAAAASISFPSENRSTRPRVAILGQAAVLTVAGLGVTGYASGNAVRTGMDFSEFMCNVMLVVSFLSSMYWLVAGALLCAGQPFLSQRVRRSLPRSFAGRLGLSLLFPGGGRGYLFALAAMTGWAIAVSIGSLAVRGGLAELATGLSGGGWVSESGGPLALEKWLGTLVSGGRMRTGPDAAFALLGWSYGAFYLGATWLTLRVVARLGVKVNPLLGLVLGIVLFLLFNLGSLAAHLSWARWIGEDGGEYSWLLFPNIFWSINQAVDQNSLDVLVLIFPAGLLVSCVGVLFSARELLDLPAPVPERVREELARRKTRLVVPGESIEDLFAGRGQAGLEAAPGE